MSTEVVTLEKAIDAITRAADQFSPDEFIDFSVIIDVHINWSLEELSPEDQSEFLHVLKKVLESHEELHRSVAWDLIIVLLPYLDSPLPKTVEIAESLIDLAAKTGNPREVYVKVLQGLSSLVWGPGADSGGEDEDDGDDDDDEEAEHTGDEAEHAVPPKHNKSQNPLLVAMHALNKFRSLLSALCTVHPRISAKFPSKFLSAELSTLLIAFTKAVETVEGRAVADVVERLLGFIKVVRPRLGQARRPSSFERPPLPPRTSTTSPQTASPAGSNQDDLEDQLQARLISSFLSHVLSGYLLRVQQSPSTAHTPDTEHDGHNHIHLAFRGLQEPTERGLQLGWAGKYDELVLRPDKSKVPGGRTLIDEERERRVAHDNAKAVVDEISSICERLGLKTEELLGLCQQGADAHSDDEEDVSEIPAPKVAAEIPLSKTGALFLLCSRLSSGSSETPDFKIYPEHSAIAETFMIYGAGQSQPALVDAILFLGQLALHTGGLGDVPESIERFFIYLQIFSVISINTPSPQSRFLANSHVARCLRAHPDEAVRLAYMRDTLEHCPFESIKAAVVGILKDEIFHATTPVVKEGSSSPSTPNSIFGTGLCLSEIFDPLFPDLGKVFQGEDERAWDKFKEIYPCFAATLNFYLFLLLNDDVRSRLGIEQGFVNKVEERFLEPVRKKMDAFKALEEKEGGTVNTMMLEMTMSRVAEVRESFSEE